MMLGLMGICGLSMGICGLSILYVQSRRSSAFVASEYDGSSNGTNGTESNALSQGASGSDVEQGNSSNGLSAGVENNPVSGPPHIVVQGTFVESNNDPHP